MALNSFSLQWWTSHGPVRALVFSSVHQDGGPHDLWSQLQPLRVLSFSPNLPLAHGWIFSEDFFPFNCPPVFYVSVNINY